MADSSSDDFTSRKEVIARALDGVLAEGEQYVVRCSGGEVQIQNMEAMEARQKYPRLYGHMLALHERIDNAGGSLIIFMLAGAGLFCLGVHLEWWDDWLGVAAMAKLRSGWFYLAALVLAFLLGGTIANWLEKRAYRQGRDELIELMKQEKLSRESLLTTILDDATVAKVAEYLVTDVEASEATRH
jgi:hypothetical protein